MSLIRLRGLGRWIASLCVGEPFKSVADRAPAGHDVNGFADPSDSPQWVVLLALCEQAAWPAIPRGTTGDAVVELPSRNGAVCHAIVSALADGARFRVALALADGVCTTASCRAALDVALLRTAGAVRMVRATVTRTTEGFDVGIEVRVDGAPDATAFGHCLSALAVAHQHIAEEIDALASEGSLASAYLTVQGVR